MADHAEFSPPAGTLDVTGACFKAVIAKLKASRRSALLTQRKATEVVLRSVESYQKAFGRGDVGARGNGRVNRPYKGSGIPAGINGLMYGRIQVGKTNASIATIALASSNGFRCYVVLTSDNTWLGKQTVERFSLQLGAGDGPIVRGWEDWRTDPRGFAASVKPYLEDTGIVLVSTKNTRNLESLAAVLGFLGAERVPGMILDDEADNASLNTNTARMARGKTNEPSAIFALIGNIRAQMPNHVFVQITATPQSLLLQGLDHPLRPSWFVMIEPGEGYIGGDTFFADASRYVVTVDGSEISELRTGKINPGADWSMPKGLGRAVCFFVTAAALREIVVGEGEVLSMLLHIDHKKISHQAVGHTVTMYLMWLDKALRNKLSETEQRKALADVTTAYDELKKTHDKLPPFDALIGRLRSTLRNAQPQIIDADNPNRKPEYRPGMNLLIGGNRLGRGVTIDGLIVTYYGRDAKTKMMDTVHQHARMFGYREALLPITRLYSPDHIVGALEDIHDSDIGTRGLLAKDGQLTVKPVWVGKQLVATRANVLNPADLNAVVGGRSIWPTRIVHNPVKIRSHVAELDRMLASYDDGKDSYHKVPVKFLCEILKRIPSDKDPGRTWDDARIQQVLLAMTGDPVNIRHGILNVRRATDRGKLFEVTKEKQVSSGFGEGTQMNQAKDRYPGVPILFLRKQAGRKSEGWSNQPFYAPTLAIPKTKFVFVFAS